MEQKIYLAIVIIASIFENNNSSSSGTSIMVKKISIVDQLIVLINSIKKNFIITEDFNYKIFLFSTNKYTTYNQYLFEEIYNCKIIYVEPDLKDPNIMFFCWSKLFTTNLGLNFSHRLKLDTDMFFCKNPLEILNFNYDIMMTYMPKLDMSIQYFNELIKLYNFKENIITDLHEIYFNKDLLINQYENNINHIKLFPYFNGGFVLIKEHLSNKFGERSLEIYKNAPNNLLKKRCRGMILQDMLGLIMLELTDNWNSTPIGINYYGKWNNIFKTIKIDNSKIYLIHYLGSTNLNDYKEFLNDSYLDYSIIINKKQIYDLDLLNKIINLKNTFWRFNKESQKKWFHENIGDSDLHLIYFRLNTIIGYGVRKLFDNYSILDTIIVDSKFRNKNIGKFIVTNLIKNYTELIVLLSEEKNMEFYRKNNFEEDNTIEFIDKNINNLKIMSKNNLNKITKLKYNNIKF